MGNLIPDGCFGEEYTDEVGFVIKPKRILGEVQSKYQKSTIIETEKFGRLLFQDGLIYLADSGNDSVMEMHIHVPMLVGKPKKSLLLIGGGDGGGIKRYYAYPDLERIVVLDVDGDFLELAKEFYPDKTDSFNDPRVEVVVVDGAEYVANCKEEFDLIAVTVGDPYTISKTLFNEAFIKNCYRILSDHGVLSMDGYMPFYTHDDSPNYWDIFALMSASFPITRIAISASPLMPGGLVSFIYSSRETDVMQEPVGEPMGNVSWYNTRLHLGSFGIPTFMREKLEGVKGFEQ